MNRIYDDNGFTLIELIVTIAIAAVVMGFAIPSFIGSIRSNRLTTNANEFVTTLKFAKSEAIKRGVQVTVRRKGPTSGVWENGWDVFVDRDGNNSFNDDGDTTLCETNADGSPKEDCLLRTYDPLPAGMTLRTGASSHKDYTAYVASGMSNTVIGDTYRLCQGTDTVNSRAIVLNSVGRVYVTSPAASCP
ncbi:GspH/FimT family pseudopilin [Methylomarinum vadi]|uniref:GspH/FimT family pseudopilin n=1 Tax=Methylomarinum vadi TaxID=438855 RepID=UPI0004DF67D6|nr:GspH/FimT family pseudopilin [Methylomarinum vadi]